LENTTHFWVTYDSTHRPVAANESRILIWLAGWEMIKDHPWGVGQGNVSVLFPKYVAGTPIAQWEPEIPHLHDDFLQILAQNGWEGLIVYVIWIGAFGWMVFKFRPPDPTAQELNWTFFSIFIAVLVWGLTEYTFSHQFMNFQFFLLGLQTRLWAINPKSGNAKGSKGRKNRPAK
jgi:O-antigen ligase